MFDNIKIMLDLHYRYVNNKRTRRMERQIRMYENNIRQTV